jgi:hypothetical protein
MLMKKKQRRKEPVYVVDAQYDFDDNIEAMDARVEKAAGREADNAGFLVIDGVRDLSWTRTKKQSALRIFENIAKLPEVYVTLTKTHLR